MPRFPDGFRWGVATAAYQIEGAVAAGGRRDSIWDTFCRRPGAIRDGHTGDVAADHYHRWPEDIALMERLGVGTYRFSIAWPRVQPDGTGPACEAGLDFYDRLTDELLSRGITPLPTLYHWDLPQPLEDAGGWLNRDTAYRLADFGALAAARLADRIPLWITLNEPFIVMALGYATGVHAPGRELGTGALPAAHHQLLGHGLAAAHAYDQLHNRLFLDPVLLGRYPDLSAYGVGPGGLDCVRAGDLELIGAPIDALGINYYSPARIGAPSADSVLPFAQETIPGYPVTAFGWPVIPAGLTELLTGFADIYGDRLPPVLITENGCSQADEVGADGAVDDQPRIRYLDGHIRAVADAIIAGVDVRGYLTWSLMDNFEWAEGYHQRFGLVHIDFDTQRRTPKSSFTWYQDLIAAQRS